VIPPYLVEAALPSPTAPDSADRRFHGFAAGGPAAGMAITLPWWAARGDSATLRGIERRGDSLARAAPAGPERDFGLYTSQAAQAYLALVRRDTADAVRRLEALPDSLCPICYYEPVTLARLLAARHEDRKAGALLDGREFPLAAPSEVLWTLERGRVAERLDQRQKAADAYQRVADVWRHADPELQPYVTEAKEGLARLTAESR
jgi:hypothetical protein